ncbi:MULTISPECIES: PTS system mannose/fructose/sorbose family transporter subunit IID [Breznakia]|uniref:PTS system IID component (Man family) n=1 Tax=Breznakia blatticola TaxID=1754012 RepID=A0A4R8A6V0_9FIRM|nr:MULTISPECIES: PTS system mannose/fructose/sorbose family transporter subunit IID [Breznakia]MDH6368064.1 mannose/fructose/N-acetylgalactosamine-specific phosphotransferase system component IID [Breznakia sp. PH1-1]MDH6405152.1 mannose/fructose/N-acetylgalactosamine-specific phosphotransferase system component IID [Breznakia sp. PF1-11]MDH6412859.1 mannose/fructose/N-acetylgalactosamine-specific phosphotransferase system component IID [Breznakia sp. PFB1-11]MDH6415228.1 mannose/fructose/N-ace
MADEKNKLLSKKDLLKSFLIWETFPQCCYNYERMMGQSVAHVFAPLIKKFYKNEPEKRKEVMKREIEFFNVHIEFGSCIIGMAIAMEEQKALGGDIPGEFITSIKTSLMGPLAGVGDTIWQGVVIPILLSICIDITLGGTVAGAIIYAVAIIVGAYALSYANFMFGYRSGSEAIMDFLEKGTLKKILKGAEVMGCLVMGGLIANYVSMQTGIEIVSSTSTFNLQTQFFDTLMPKILPFGFTLFVYWLLKKRVSSLKIIGIIILIAIVGGVTGILA